jgi:hypothetical protein
MPTYEDCINNLTIAVENLQDTNIKFLFFLASDLSQPKVKTNFKKCKIDKTNCYVVNGYAKNYLYIYRESVLKYITSALKSSKSWSFYDVNSLSVDARGDTNHGDHIDFSIKNQRKHPYPLVLTHFTQYDDDGYMNFTRTAPEFNFLLDPIYLKTFNDFLTKVPYVSKNGTLPRLMINNVYNDLQTCKIIYEFCKVAIDSTIKLKGGRKNNKNKKCAIQKGGTIYKKLNFDSDTFISFLSSTFFRKVAEMKPNLETIQVILDEYNEINTKGNKYFVICYDFENYRNIFYIETNMALVACYAHTQIKANNAKTLEKFEMDCHQKYFKMLDSLDAFVNASSLI